LAIKRGRFGTPSIPGYLERKGLGLGIIYPGEGLGWPFNLGFQKKW